MAHIRHVLLPLLLVLLLTSGCVVVGNGSTRSPATAPEAGTPPAGAEGPAETRIARDIFDRVNDERAARGLEPVAWDDSLAQVAVDWSGSMAGTGRLEHQDIGALLEEEALAGFRGIGENIFTASAPVPAGVAHVGWMESDGHRVNVLNPGWNRLGIGVVCASDGSVWATQQFGRTAGADRPAVAEETPPAEPVARPAEDGPSCG